MAKLVTIANFDGTNGTAPGADPEAGLTMDAAGNLWGTTSAGGAYGDGTVFEIAAGSHAYTDVLDFTGTSGTTPGANPYTGLTVDSAGNLWGTTYGGGANNAGTVFEITAVSHSYTHVLDFTGLSGTAPAQWPRGDLTVDAAGNLWGTTRWGGANGIGAVFEIAAGSHAYTDVVNFTGASGTATPGVNAGEKMHRRAGVKLHHG